MAPTHSPPGTKRRRRSRLVAPRYGRVTSGKDPVPIVQEAALASGPTWTGKENLASLGIRSPDRPTVANRYADYAFPAAKKQSHILLRSLGAFHGNMSIIYWNS